MKSAAVRLVVQDHESLPARGAWIEILMETVGVGLIHVAPRKGSVD